MGQAAGVAIMPPNAEATFSPATGGASVFAGVVVAKRGTPGVVLHVTPDTLKKVLGEPIHPHVDPNFEPYRHVYQALKGGNGYVVRVIPDDMQISILILTKGKEAGEKPRLYATTRPADPSKSSLMDIDAYFYIEIADGDDAQNRSLSLIKNPDRQGLFTLILKETDSLGHQTLLDTIQVSLDPEATNDMGQPAYLPVALENNTHRLSAGILSHNIGSLPEDYDGFEGGFSGTLANLSNKSYENAIAILRSSTVNYTSILSLGCYQPFVLSALAQLANEVRVDMFYDLLPSLGPSQAIDADQSHGFGHYAHICRYHFPYTCRDDFSGANVAYGLSGNAFVAKAKGVAMVSDVGGYHLSPAGQSRGIIHRRNIKPFAFVANINREAYVNSGINTVGFASDGAVMIDDALTTYSKKIISDTSMSIAP
ncbi:hypothetical protein Xsze_04261 [Xenorhabdus szentirmaii DSM 16338]|nr:hypothetical protein Xsze_04261 [Xenorhabdus szentirmaii DSM 16338]